MRCLSPFVIFLYINFLVLEHSNISLSLKKHHVTYQNKAPFATIHGVKVLLVATKAKS